MLDISSGEGKVMKRRKIVERLPKHTNSVRVKIKDKKAKKAPAIESVEEYSSRHNRSHD